MAIELDKDTAVRIFENQDKLLASLAMLFKWTQQKEAEKVPANWNAKWVNLWDPSVTQIVPRNMRRDAVSIANSGPSDVFLSPKYFEPDSWVATYTSGTTGAVLDVLVLAAGGHTTIPSTGGIWAYSINYGTGNNENAILSILESIYSTDSAGPGPSVPSPGYASELLRGPIQVGEISLEPVR